MTTPSFRVATLPEIRLMLDWAADEGWNPGQEDAEAFHAADPQGFFVATQDGVPVAAISVVNHSDDFAFLGLYLCRPAFRGRGIGFALWNFALSHSEGRTIGLDGVPDQEANYARSGFVLTGRSCRLQGTLAPTELRAPLATPDDLAAIIDLDRAATGVDRPRFLTEWVANRPTRKTVLLRDANGISGFATARLCRDGCKIGPVVAPSAAAGLELAGQAAAALDQTEVIVDVPDADGDMGRLLADSGFAMTFSTARMYRGPAPVAGPTLQAIATMELG
ncbi:GNAT family N-acetyltransferase [Seohaeicola saemankumensis]|nr:GNAT family N-acetyltransferase [Seohaeicola saemankumensis]MCA0873068.1 GNAT family N-acetyltransferase [Seohaeicola saemankumensis]